MKELWLSYHNSFVQFFDHYIINMLKSFQIIEYCRYFSYNFKVVFQSIINFSYIYVRFLYIYKKYLLSKMQNLNFLVSSVVNTERRLKIHKYSSRNKIFLESYFEEDLWLNEKLDKTGIRFSSSY